jgi:hypothetical protein
MNFLGRAAWRTCLINIEDPREIARTEEEYEAEIEGSLRRTKVVLLVFVAGCTAISLKNIPIRVYISQNLYPIRDIF